MGYRVMLKIFGKMLSGFKAQGTRHKAQGTYTLNYKKLFNNAYSWYLRTRKQTRSKSYRNSWWIFHRDFKRGLMLWLERFLAGEHQFSPIKQHYINGEIVRVWSYIDRLMIHLLYQKIKPTFKHIISRLCLHLAGPSIIKYATDRIREALASGKYNYVLRIDIRSYYASIDRRILVEQLRQNFDDPIALRYLEDIATIAIDRKSQVTLPVTGIPCQSGMSPFFAALYLAPLDAAFSKKKGCLYLRFVDDIIILVQSKRQYAKARKCLFSVLTALRLKISKHKTRMGKLREGFHFLGINFEVTRIPQGKIQKVAVSVHPRTPRRALDQVIVMQKDAVHPANIQRYLSRWAIWWKYVSGLNVWELLSYWTARAILCCKEAVWYGRGLLIGLCPLENITFKPVLLA